METLCGILRLKAIALSAVVLIAARSGETSVIVYATEEGAEAASLADLQGKTRGLGPSRPSLGYARGKLTLGAGVRICAPA